VIPIVSTRKLMTPSTALNLTQVSASSAGIWDTLNLILLRLGECQGR
jgi:hypothetical protein